MPKVTMIVTDQDSQNAERICELLGLAEKAQAVSYALDLVRKKLEANIPAQTIERSGPINPVSARD